MTVLLFANGDLEKTEWVKPYLAAASAVIAADGGTKHLYRLDHLPDVVIGDMDSLPQQVRPWLVDANVPLVIVPVEKDETDLELALLYAAEHYKEKILIFAAFGGRLDQMLANILLLAHPMLAEHRVELRAQHQRAWLVTGTSEIRGEIGDLVSLVPLGGDVLVRQTQGLQWALTDETLALGPARGVSNVMTRPLASVVIGSGTLLCIHTWHGWGR